MTVLSRRTLLAAALGSPVVIAMPRIAQAQTPSVYAASGVAVDGTDVVAYFTQSKPVAGEASITHTWNGATWRFANVANRDAFAADPEAYAPQYGGYCAYAVSNGYTASTDPKAWSIVDGKLYLNHSRSVRALWNTAQTRRIADADANWPDVLK